MNMPPKKEGKADGMTNHPPIGSSFEKECIS